MDLSRMNNHWLKQGFQMNTNLSELHGENMNGLIDSLNHYSMQIPNMRIIERILYQHPSVFRNPESIKEVMRRGEPVISAFTMLGNCDRNCNIRWLVLTLNKIREFRPMRNLLETGIPTIVLRFPPPNTRVIPGQTIELEIRTIAETQIQWWKNHGGQAEIIQDHIRIGSFSTVVVPYHTKESDKGYFYMEVVCRGGIRETSPWIYVGKDEITEEDKQNYESFNNKNISGKVVEKTKTESNSTRTRRAELSMDIVPSPETDGIKRVALLIGIMNYKPNLRNLKAPETDLLDLERVLLSIGFATYCFGDLKHNQMKHVLNEFSKNCIAKDSYVFFYFAGHGNSLDKVDYVQLIDNQIRVSDVLNILIHSKPKVLISIFDMCRDNKYEPLGNSKLFEANIPINENLILVMSTLPRHRSFEKPIGFENTSLIMKPLCDNLSAYARTKPINLVLAHFISTCENIEQRPTMSCVGMQDIIGIDIVLPRFKPKIQWMKVPEDRQILKYITVDFKIFHNILTIYLDQNISQQTIKASIEIPASEDSGKYLLNFDPNGICKIDLFQHQQTLKDGRVLYFDLCVVNEMMHITKYTIMVLIPREIIPFILVN